MSQVHGAVESRSWRRFAIRWLVIVAVAAGFMRMATVNLAAAARIEFVPDDGGQWCLSMNDEPLVPWAPLFRVVADGVPADRWQQATTDGQESGLKISGRIHRIPALVAEMAIDHPGGGDCWEFKLTLKNTGAAPVIVSRADSLAGRIEGRWHGLSFTSMWGEEWEPEDFALPASREIDVRSGRSSMGRSPWLGLRRASGGAIALAPVWSGNWHIGLEEAEDGTTFTAGISPWKFAHVLAPGAVFEAPSVLIAVGHDLQAASVAMGRAVGATLPRSAASEAIPVEWNHWWPYEDQDIDEATFLANVSIATELGIEISVLDAGWFGASDADTSWWDVRGDFSTENRARFPHGIAWLAEETRRRGQKFGIWMEVEAVGRKAGVRRERPELLARRDDDPPVDPLDPEDPGFLGYVCLGSPAGRTHVRGLLESVVEKTRCAWIKVDFNLDPKAGCSRADHEHVRGDGLYAHYRGLYAILDAFRAAHPEILVEGCASGGLRVDAGLLRHVHGVFLSDPDWTRHHLQVVHGASRLLPPAAMLHWPMSEWRGQHPEQTLNLRDAAITEEAFDALVRSAFLHRFGLSWRLPDLPERWRERLKRHITLYKEVVRPLVREGDLRRLTETPRRQGDGESQPAFQLSANDRHLVLGFALSPATEDFVIHPAALSPTKRYRLLDLEFDARDTMEERSGAEWMETGLPPVRRASFLGVLEPM